MLAASVFDMMRIRERLLQLSGVRERRLQLNLSEATCRLDTGKNEAGDECAIPVTMPVTRKT